MMVGLGTPAVLMDERMGHEDGSVQARYSHVTPEMRIYKEEIFDNPDYVFLGCWTSGLFVILQHPEAAWVEFAEILPSLPDAKLALFTTYKILTGSMFKNMYQHLEDKFAAPSLTLKSRSEK